VAQPSGRNLYDVSSDVRRLLGDLEFPFLSISAAETRHKLDEVEMLLDRYLLPRLEHQQAPLTVAVAGSTGVGKSTVVNAVVGDVVSVPGVLRPTTRIPVLVHHPADAAWFGQEDVLLSERCSVRTIPSGIALLDLPPFASVRGPGRSVTNDGLTKADVWLFTTTAARYADAVPWELLTRAVERRVLVAVVVNRITSGAVNEIRSHLREMLASRSLGDAPLFVVEEAELDSSGMVPALTVQPIVQWLHDLAADETRQATIERVVGGAVENVIRRVTAAVESAEDDVFDETTREALIDAVDEMRRVRGDSA
jgi:hypothetical protein